MQGQELGRNRKLVQTCDCRTAFRKLRSTRKEWSALADDFRTLALNDDAVTSNI